MSFLHLVRPQPLLGFIISKLFTIKSTTNILDNRLGISIACWLSLSSTPGLYQQRNNKIMSWFIPLKLKFPSMQPSGRPHSSHLRSHGFESNTYYAHSFFSFPFLLYFIYSVTYLYASWKRISSSEVNYSFELYSACCWTLFNEQLVGLNSVYYFYILSSLSESS